MEMKLFYNEQVQMEFPLFEAPFFGLTHSLQKYAYTHLELIDKSILPYHPAFE